MARKLGVLAGGGALPALIVRHCVRSARPFFVVAFEGQCDPALTAPIDGQPVPHISLRIGAAGKAIKCLRREGVEELIMAGAIRRPSVSELRPDLWTMRFLARTGGLGGGDDKILTALVGALEGEGFSVIGPESVLPDLVAPSGVFGSVQPEESARADISVGIAAALELGGRDVGQGAVVRDGVIVARETSAGTDAMLAECARDHPETPSGVLVKVAKPDQERRADLPTIGVETVRAARRAGLCGIAVEAGGAFVIDRKQVVADADAEGLFVIGVSVKSEGAG
ncbi:MAG: UDP-2,3-diacylglucosamine diphosphatase LpxI [Rhodospirillales bacterium]|nr:UDP-2,3-diacylglucosamine diphosphatase LpxI [Rhodospirillales bacterium]